MREWTEIRRVHNREVAKIKASQTDADGEVMLELAMVVIYAHFWNWLFYG